MLRRDQLCPGPGECFYAYQESQGEERCEECPVSLLDAYLATGGGQIIQRTLDLEFALQAGITVRLEDIGYREFLLLRFLAQERNRYLNEAVRRD